MTSRRAVVLLLTVSLLLGLAVGITRAQDAQSKGVSVASSQGTAFTYQGRLMRDGRPINGTCDLRFRLFDAANGGSQVGSTVTKAGTTVTNGLVSVSLDFGADAFRGDACWLEVAVRCPAGSGSYTVLSPRQPITPAPYALFSLGVPWNGITGMPAGFADGVDNDTTYSAGEGLTLSGTTFSLRGSFRLPQGCSNGQVPKWNGTAWTCGDDDVGTTGAFWSLTGNAGTDPATHFLGTTDNKPLELRVNNARALRIEPGTSPNLIGGYSGNSVADGVVGATIGGGGSNLLPNQVTASYGTIDGGYHNTASSFAATVGGGYSNTASDRYAIVGGGKDNTASSDFATVGGGTYNTASDQNATVGGGRGNVASRYAATVSGGWNNTASGYVATVGGGSWNTASGKDATVGGGYNNEACGAGATVGGGGYDGTNTAGNRALAPASTIGGGLSNVITTTAYYASIGGGWRNTASGARSTVAGGEQNTASGYLATVGGGFNNRVTGDRSVIAGGVDNTASGAWATIPGGSGNVAAGNYSFAAGHRAKANKNGCFVWGDSTNADVSCMVSNRTIFRSSGGFYIYTNGSLTSGVRVAAGGGSWASLSDRNAKENVEPVDPMWVLEQLARMPVSTWNYKSQDESIRHMGPMAQDFYAAFGLGEDDTHIGALDADGVLMAAVQGLYAQNQAQSREISRLKAENAALRQQLADLAARVVALEQDR